MPGKNSQTYRCILLMLVYLCTACKPIISATPIPTPSLTNRATPSSHYSLFISPECSSYCWAGIEISRTAFNEAKKILTTRYGAQNVENVNTENLIWKAHGIDGLNEGYAIFSNDVIVDLSLTFEGDATITAQDLLELFGEPTWVIIAGQPNNHCFAFDLLYPTKGLYISLDKKSGQTGIYPSQSVFMIRFLETKITENWNVYDGGQVEWDGYKDYCP